MRGRWIGPRLGSHKDRQRQWEEPEAEQGAGFISFKTSLPQQKHLQCLHLGLRGLITASGPP